MAMTPLIDDIAIVRQLRRANIFQRGLSNKTSIEPPIF